MTTTPDSIVEVAFQDGVDVETQLLIAKLALDEIKDIDALRKGKKRADVPLSDEEIALRIQSEYLNSLLGVLNDYKLASSIDRAIATDARYIASLCVIDQAEHDDHRAASALQHGHALPRQTASQHFLEEFTPHEAMQASLDTGVDTVTNASQGPRNVVKASPDTEVEAVTDALQGLHIGTTTINQHRPSRQPRVECVICGDMFSVTRTLHAPCSHYYCRGCIIDLVQASLRDETLHPLRCCHQSLSIEVVYRFIPSELRVQFEAKRTEFTTPTTSRIYCPSPTCSAFLGSFDDKQGAIMCEGCGTIVCSQCKDRAHPGEDCLGNKALQEVRDLATANGWQTCPGCHSIVELSQGCYHMTCRCTTQFCYLCAARWKTCGCAQWDEQRLLNDAERRVVNEFGRRDAVIQPALHAERVYNRMEALRQNHECFVHNWRFRHGGGVCEECGDFLPVFMMRCTNCQTLVCRRCSVNRL